MIDTSQLSDETIPGILEAYLSYGQGPVPPGICQIGIEEVRRIIRSRFINFLIDFLVVGEARLTDGTVTEEYDGRLIPRQWVSSVPRGKDPSMVFDLLRSAGIPTLPRSNRELEEVIFQIQAAGELLTVELDWEGFSKALWDRKLKELTGATNSTQARDQATKAQKRAARRFAVRAQSYRDFPDDPDGEGKLHLYTDPETGEEVEASPKIRRFLPSGRF